MFLLSLVSATRTSRCREPRFLPMCSQIGRCHWDCALYGRHHELCRWSCHYHQDRLNHLHYILIDHVIFQVWIVFEGETFKEMNWILPLFDLHLRVTSHCLKHHSMKCQFITLLVWFLTYCSYLTIHYSSLTTFYLFISRCCPV